MKKVKLKRDLRREILRGHPWIYREMIEAPSQITQSQLVQVLDRKSNHLAWAMYDPNGPLALRVLSTERAALNKELLKSRILKAIQIRSAMIAENTNAFRLINGEGDRLPGLITDIYNGVAIVQFDGAGPLEFWEPIWVAQVLMESPLVSSVYLKGRRNEGRTFEHLAGDESPGSTLIKENGVVFEVDLAEGQKTGFFLDQRENRDYLRRLSRGKSVLNVFSYTGGFSVYSGLGGATEVRSLDISPKALELAQKNWELNQLDGSKHMSLCGDALELLQEMKTSIDLIVVDPPSMAHSEKQKASAVLKYTEIFSAAARLVSVGGDLVLSSCSSHIGFEDFYEIVVASLSKARRQGRVLRISGQSPDHPFPHACRELQYLKFIHLSLDE